MTKAVETREEIRRMMEREWQRFRAAHPDLDLRDEGVAGVCGKGEGSPQHRALRGEGGGDRRVEAGRFELLDVRPRLGEMVQEKGAPVVNYRCQRGAVERERQPPGSLRVNTGKGREGCEPVRVLVPEEGAAAARLQEGRAAGEHLLQQDRLRQGGAGVLEIQP